MEIKLLRISSCDLSHHPAYVAADLKQVEKVCELIGTKNTVWSRDEIDVLIARAAKSTNGAFNMMDRGNRIDITIHESEKPTPEKDPVRLRQAEGLLALKIWLKEIEDAGIDHATIGEGLKWARLVVEHAMGEKPSSKRRYTPVFNLFILKDDGTWIQPAFCVEMAVNHPSLSEKEIRDIAENHFDGFISYGLQEDPDAYQGETTIISI